MFSMLIQGGLIVDGTGNPGFYGTIGIDGNSVRVLRGDISDVESERVLDASGKVVCPGFIDVHSHSGLVILSDPSHESKVRQGITTELVGVDGNSYAPFKSKINLQKFITLNAGLDGDPSMGNEWATVREYLSLFDRKVSVNVAYLVGNSPIRIGTVGWDNRKPSKNELQDMRSLLRESLEDGAFGMSTGLDYPPGSYADTDELVSLSKEVSRFGGIYHTHVRNGLGDRHLDPFREAIDIGRRSGAPVHITHLSHGTASSSKTESVLRLVEESRTAGIDVTFDDFPYEFGGTRAIVVFPEWAHDGGPQKLKEILASREGRERLRREVQPQGQGWQDMRLTYFKNPHNKVYEGRSVAEIGETLGKNPIDALADLVLDEDLRVSYIAEVVDGPTLRQVVSHPLYMLGTDALLLGDYPSPTAYGAATFLLSQLVREEEHILLTEAIRKMTSYPAQRLGIDDRGVLRSGMKADIIVFDPATVDAPATREMPKQYSTGIDYVIVNGTIVIDHNDHTGAFPGLALRQTDGF